MRILSMGSALKNMWRNLVMSIASILSVTATLVILGITLVLIVNVNQATLDLQQKIDLGTIKLKEGLSEQDIDRLNEKLQKTKNIKSVRFVPKDEVLERFIQQHSKEDREVYKSIKNPLPNVFEIHMLDISKVDALRETLSKNQEFTEIKFEKNLISDIVNLSKVIRNVAIVIISVLLFITVLIINNTIKIGIVSRSEEIFVMRYVGATRSYIRWPFLIEGIILGLIGALISGVIIFFGYKEILVFVQKSMPKLVQDSKFYRDGFILYSIGVVNIVIGVGVGLIGSIFSMRKYLKV